MSSGRTVMITAPNGGKVRTVFSKSYYTVGYGETTRTYVGNRKGHYVGEYVDHEPKPVANVTRRSDNVDACRAVARRHGGRAMVVRVRMVDGKPVVTELYRYHAGVLVANAGMLS